MTGDLQLAEILVRALSLEGSDQAAEQAAVEARLRAGLEQGRARTPAARVSVELWLTHVATKLDASAGLLATLDGVHLDELYLVAGCLAGDRASIEAFQQHYAGPVGAALAKLGVEPATREELAQEMMAALLISRTDETPKLANYSGRGSLAGYLKVIATRAALRQKRRRGPVGPPADSLLIERYRDTVEDPEIEHVRQRYAGEFRQAIEQAFGELRSDQRTLLRMYVTDGLTLGELAALHEVNASTVSRWLTRIREGLLERTRTHLTRALELRPSEYESLNKVLASDLHVSVERLLADETEEP